MAQELAILSRLGYRAYSEGLYDNAADIYEQAWQQASEANNDEDVIVSRFWLAESLRMADQKVRAVPHYSAVIASRDIAITAVGRNRVGIAYAGLIDSCMVLADVDRSALLNTANEGIEWSERWKCRGALICLHEMRAGVYRQVGDLTSAISDQEKAVAMRRRWAEASGYILPSLLNNLALYLQQRGSENDIVRVESVLSESLRCHNSNDYTQQWSHHRLAELYRSLGQWGKAEHHFLEAVMLGRRTQSRAIVGSLDSLVRLYLDQGNLEDAQVYLREAARCFLKLPSAVTVRERFNLLDSLSRLREAQAGNGSTKVSRRLRRMARIARERQLRYAQQMDTYDRGRRADRVKSSLTVLRDAGGT